MSTRQAVRRCTQESHHLLSGKEHVMFANIHPESLSWRVSSRSGGGNNCVEVALPNGAAAVRDSKHRAGGALVFSRAQWHGFLSAAPGLDQAGR